MDDEDDMDDNDHLDGINCEGGKGKNVRMSGRDGLGRLTAKVFKKHC